MFPFLFFFSLLPCCLIASYSSCFSLDDILEFRVFVNHLNLPGAEQLTVRGLVENADIQADPYSQALLQELTKSGVLQWNQALSLEDLMQARRVFSLLVCRAMIPPWMDCPGCIGAPPMTVLSWLHALRQQAAFQARDMQRCRMTVKCWPVRAALRKNILNSFSVGVP